MAIFKLTNDKATKRVRWIMLSMMIFSIIITLCGQPASYWQHPETAIRGDELSVNNITNHTFEFFLGQGWLLFVISSLLYVFIAFLLVSVLPRKLALIAIFSFIFGYYFGGTNWLAVRWNMGVNGSAFYGLILAPSIVLSSFPRSSSTNDQNINGLRWLMVTAMSLDMINTLLGQPSSYWQHSETVHEANSFSRFLLIHGWYTYVLVDLIYFFALFWLTSILPRSWALVCIFFFLFVSFIGASNWFFYQWRMGVETPVIYGVLLSVVIVLVAFPSPKIPTPT